MRFKIKISHRHFLIGILLFLTSSLVAAAEFVVDIGEVSVVKILFSYPNIDHEDQSLEETVQIYLSDSMAREDIGSYEAKFFVDNGRGKILFSGQDLGTVKSLAKRYDSYFEVGEVAIPEFNALKSQTADWHPKWQFLLPQGIAIENARVIEIMDFPPITLIPKQDYLDSKTTNQWWYLLGKNGVTINEKPLYSSILDIVPVAAPASHGKRLREAGVYDGHFPKYTDAMLKLLSKNRNIDANRPLLALGYPIREWIRQNWNIDLKVNDVALLEISPGVISPVIGGNHPAYFLRSRGARGADSPVVRAILRQDLITAAWAAEMGSHPDADPVLVLEKAKSKWGTENADSNPIILHELGVVPPTEEQQKKKLIMEEPTPEQLEKIEKDFYEQNYIYDE